MNSNIPGKRVMIVAGEASGDFHGANLVSAIKAKNGNVGFSGIGGHRLAGAGVDVIMDASEISVVGITEVLPKIKNIFKGISRVKNRLRNSRPDLLILIDFPDFNLHIAAAAKRQGIPVLYYISPQIWAWRSGRVRKIARVVDHMAVILPFEEKFYRKHNVPVTFVGHPLLDKPETQNIPKRPELTGPPVIGLLPGSRDREIETLLPVMLDTAEMLRDRYENIRFIVSVAPSIRKDTVEKAILGHGESGCFELSSESVDSIFGKCTLIVAASGTVALEAAIAGIPMVVIYKVSPLTYLMGKTLIRVKNFSLANLIFGKEIIPELAQDQASPENIAREIVSMLDNKSRYNGIRRGLTQVAKMLGGPGASGRVADIALDMLAK